MICYLEDVCAFHSRPSSPCLKMEFNAKCVIMKPGSRLLAKLISLALASLVFGSCGAYAAKFVSAAHVAPLPNIVIIFIDDQGYADFGLFVAKGCHTPNLEHLRG